MPVVSREKSDRKVLRSMIVLRCYFKQLILFY